MSPVRDPFPPTNQIHVRQLPPFGREVMQRLTNGETMNLWIYANRPDPWRVALLHRNTIGPGSVLVLPAGQDPKALRWPPVRELLADITNLPGETVRTLANALVRDGVRLAYLLDSVHHDRSIRVIVRRGTR